MKKANLTETLQYAAITVWLPEDVNFPFNYKRLFNEFKTCFFYQAADGGVMFQSQSKQYAEALQAALQQHFKNAKFEFRINVAFPAEF